MIVRSLLTVLLLIMFNGWVHAQGLFDSVLGPGGLGIWGAGSPEQQTVQQFNTPMYYGGQPTGPDGHPQMGGMPQGAVQGYGQAPPPQGYPPNSPPPEGYADGYGSQAPAQYPPQQPGMGDPQGPVRYTAPPQGTGRQPAAGVRQPQQQRKQAASGRAAVRGNTNRPKAPTAPEAQDPNQPQVMGQRQYQQPVPAQPPAQYPQPGPYPPQAQYPQQPAPRDPRQLDVSAEDLPAGSVRMSTTTPQGTTVQFYPPVDAEMGPPFPPVQQPVPAAKKRPTQPRRAAGQAQQSPGGSAKTQERPASQSNKVSNQGGGTQTGTPSIAMPQPVEIPQGRDPRAGWGAALERRPRSELPR